MGRTTFGSFVPRFYCITPVLHPQDAATGIFRAPQTPFLADVSKLTTPREDLVGATFLGAMLSVGAATNANASLLEPKSYNAGRPGDLIVQHVVAGERHIAPATGTHIVSTHRVLKGASPNFWPVTGTPAEFLHRCGFGDETGGTGGDNHVNWGNNTWTLNGGDTFTDVAMLRIDTPYRLQARAAQETAALPGTATTYTNFPGPTFGGYVQLPFQAVDQASGVGSYTVIRRWEAPFDMRVQSGVLGCHGAGAGNSLRIYNATTGAIIFTQDLVAAGYIQKNIEAGTWTPVAGGRDIKRGDVLELQGKTGGTGFTEAFANLYACSRGHFNVAGDSVRDIYLGGDSLVATADPNFFHTNRLNHIRSGFSGPCAGGILPIYVPPATLAANQAATLITSAPIPCNGEIFAVDYAYEASGALNTVQVYNNTQSTVVLATETADQATFTGVAKDQAALTTLSVVKGDQVGLVVDTDVAAGMTNISAILWMRTTGHINAYPRND